MVAKLTLFLGCMFSGKSTALITGVSRLRAVGKKVLIVNHEQDTRCGEKEAKTHSGQTADAIKVSHLSLVSAGEYDVIGVDEAQFFSDLSTVVPQWLKEGKEVLVAGLSGDFQGKPFGSITDLIPHADSIEQKKALCMHRCDGGDLCGAPAIYSKRIVGSKERILAGGKDEYIAVCREHFQ